MKKEIYNVMIVDDLPDSTLIIQEMLKNITFIQLVCPVVTKAYEAYQMLENGEYEVDILLLDMDMPEMNGEVLMGMLSDRPVTVLCTSYAEYGFKAAEIGAKAILSKTSSLRILRQVLSDMVVLVDQKIENELPPVMDFTFKTLDGDIKTLQIGDIYYASVLDKILTIYTKLEQFDLRMTLRVFLLKMPKNDFVQCHKSYAVPLDKIVCATAGELTIIDREDGISISKGYASDFHKQFKYYTHKKIHG